MSDNTHSERKHAKISPSGLKNFKACPGYIREDKGDEVHPVTLEGTLIHEALDNEDFSTLNSNSVSWQSIAKRTRSCCPPRTATSTASPSLLSPAVSLARDQVQVLGDHADVLDWKMGYHRVDDAEDNMQGKAYSLGVFRKFPNVKTITAHFVQPRLGYTTSHTFDRSNEAELEYEIRSIVAAVANATADDYKPCSTNCAYCARHDCPAVAQKVYDTAKAYATQKDIAKKAEAKLLNQPEPAAVLEQIPTEFYPRALTNPEEISKALDFVPIAESWCKSVSMRAKQMRLREGIEILGWDLAHRKGAKRLTMVPLHGTW